MYIFCAKWYMIYYLVIRESADFISRIISYAQRREKIVHRGH